MAKTPQLTKSRNAVLQKLRSFFIYWREPLALFTGWRLALGALPFFAWVLFPVVKPDSRSGYILPSLNFWGERLLGVWSRWDGEWFLKVATQGYQDGDGTLAFFPLYPALVKILGVLLLENYLLAAVILSSAFALLCLCLLYELARREFGEETAKKSALYLAVFPTAFFLVACYSESLFLALVLGSFLAARRYRNWAWAAGLAALATLTRNLGVTLIIPLAWEWWKAQKENGYTSPLAILKNRGAPGSFSFLFLPVVTLVAFMGCIGSFTGNPLNLIKAQASWDRAFDWPWNTILRAIQLTISPIPLPENLRANPPVIYKLDYDFICFIISLIIIVISLKFYRNGNLPYSYLFYNVIALLMPLFSPMPYSPFASFIRFALAFFPAYLVLAYVSERKRWLPYVYTIVLLPILTIFCGAYMLGYMVA